MNDDKLELDARLASWPAPGRDDDAWEAQAGAIARVAIERAGEEPLGALFEAPDLAPDDDEPAEAAAPAPARSAPRLEVIRGGASEHGRSVQSGRSGEQAMSDELDGTSEQPTPPQSIKPASIAPDRPRPSLRAIAERASQAGLSRPPASKAGSMPPPAAQPERKSLLAPPPSKRPSRPPEASSDDSGIVDLKLIHASVTAQQKAAAEAAKPASEGLFDDEPAAAAKPASAPPPAATAAAAPASAAASAGAAAQAVAPPAAEKKSSGPMIGVAIAVLGIAAAAAIVLGRDKPVTAPPAAPVAAEVKPAEPVAKVEAPKEAPAPAATATADPAATAEPVAAAPAASGAAPVGAPSGAAGALAAADPKGAAAAPAAMGTAPAAAAKPATGAPGDLASAMAAAAGAENKGAAATGAEKAEPAAGSKAQNVPEQPSQGSVQSAIGALMGGAKACVAGADDVSRATITFSSGGGVSNVSVTGWAAAHGKTGCVKGALQGAKVPPFSKSSYTVGMTIRP
jgi:hypothetical protein